MKHFSSLLLLFSIAAFAQNTANQKKDSAYIATYKTVRIAYLAFSEANETDKLTAYADFLKKTGYSGDNEIINEEDGLLNWVISNPEKSLFKDANEARTEWQKVKPTAMAMANFKKITKIAENKYGRKIVIDAMMNEGVPGEDPKTDPEYIATSKELKVLIAKQQNSDSYRQWQSLRSAYMKKANFIPKKDKLEYGETLINWVEKNLPKTMFSSIMQAKKEWITVENAEKAEKEDNAALYTLQRSSLKKFGTHIYTDALIEIMEGN